ncbi:hypothetical protein LTR37_000981 [Vermiconidia calcicola]|uniref:Uncharacterized protein n=1 Tax=Vermiconidia calcicola TaxID=1690605 RepID=A0ACC3NY76_9PEZI|nr:hypothetical protein LTR37_000981 [Vermiconidia calcicola]
MPRQLTITPKPFKSSGLAIPPSPFSPKLPISPPASPPRDGAISTARTRTRPGLEFSPPPPEPLNWLWQCHICNRVYQLGVTRRCPDDGHFFCAGTTTVKRSKRTGNRKTIRHKACASEFDYQGWKAWGVWRRNVAEQIEAAETLELLLNDEPMPLFAPNVPDEGKWMNGTWAKKSVTQKATKDFWAKDCYNCCDYPSECRWGKQYGVQTPPAIVTVPSSPSATQESKEEPETKTSFDDILLDVTSAIANPNSDEYLEPLTQMNAPPSPEEDTRKPSMDDLLQSVKRRKRRSAGTVPSPLASNPPPRESPEAGSPSTSRGLQKAFDDFDLEVRKSFGRAGDVVASFLGPSRRNPAALDDEKAEAFVAGLKVQKRRSNTGF